MPSLLNMPKVVMNLILEKSDYCSIQCLRKSCRDLRHFIDDVKPESKLEKFEITVYNTKIIVNSVFRDQSESKIVYEHRENGCLLKFNKKKKLLDNLDFSEVVAGDLQYLLNMTKCLDSFDVIIDHYDKVAERLQDLLHPGIHPIKVKNFYMCFFWDHQISWFLSLLEVSKLEKIDLYCGDERCCSETLKFRDAYVLEQWKKAKEFEASEVGVHIPIKHMVHFEKIRMESKKVPVNMIVKLKKAFLRNSYMKKYVFEYQIEPDYQRLNQLIGQPYKNHLEDIIQWFYEIPNSPQEVLVLTSHSVPRTVWHFSFERVERRSVPVDVFDL